MDNTTKERIKSWTPLGRPILDIAETEHTEQKRFETFAGQWQEISDSISWTTGSQPADLPGFFLKNNILYSALPLERELSPFLKGLDALDEPALDDGLLKTLSNLETPCRMTLYIALQCPHCPGMVEQLLPLAAACENIHLHIIDGSLFPEKAQEDKVMSAPCLILNDETRWTGAVAQEEIVDMILNKESMDLDTKALKTILEDGRAAWITERMLASNQLFKGFSGLLLHETWSVRLGAMVVVEALAEKSPKLCTELEKTLIDVFSTKDVPVQGDILYALGEIGTPDTRDWIEAQQETLTHEDLKDAAADAIQSIEDRYSA
ncbi:thioredoxin family protein [uncultured Desulfobacter sp.]|uniref:thioredoxin family protein n=1 Tax=uncultured Desulfobacter sp. TaxID=240139 RepID=UPI002AA6A813|nr:thioredoxin family protein [uncultured Desulfobacter sp.]